MEAGRAVAEGIHRADAGAEVLVRPLADGGEGTVEALTSGMNGSRQQVQVTGPLGTPVICEYGIIEASGTAEIEMGSHSFQMKKEIRSIRQHMVSVK